MNALLSYSASGHWRERRHRAEESKCWLCHSYRAAEDGARSVENDDHDVKHFLPCRGRVQSRVPSVSQFLGLHRVMLTVCCGRFTRS